jgi:hypothetical protein
MIGAWNVFVFRDAVTTPRSGEEHLKGGPEQERGVRRVAPNNPSMEAPGETPVSHGPENTHRSTCGVRHTRRSSLWCEQLGP